MNRIPYNERTKLPPESGVYIIFSENSCLYVGSSINIRQRVMAHHRRNLFVENNASYITWIPTEFGKLGEAESNAIRENLPILNKLASRSIDKFDPKGKEVSGEFTNIRDYVINLMRSRAAKISANEISEGTGLTISWLSQFSRGSIPNPGVNNLEKLYCYLTGKRIKSLKNVDSEVVGESKMSYMFTEL